MRFCGVVAAGPYVQLATLEEVRTDEPPIRLHATFYEPGSAEQVAAELEHLGEVAVGVGLALGEGRAADHDLRRRGVNPLPPTDAGRTLLQTSGLSLYQPEGPAETVPDGAYATAPAFETHPDGVFFALRGIRLPAKRHPLGIQLRIEELLDEHVEDESDLWHRRIEELEAVAVALAAHRFAVGHACWVGDPAEGVIVLPGSRLPERFSGEGVIPPVSRIPLG
jgi:predicted nuclease with RNAse H fold